MITASGIYSKRSAVAESRATLPVKVQTHCQALRGTSSGALTLPGISPDPVQMLMKQAEVST
jgi:hypothetical protein